MTRTSALILATAALAALAVTVTPASGAGAAASTPPCNAKNFAGALIQIQGAAGRALAS